MNEEILIVDDCEDARALLGLYLKKSGYRVCEAASAEEALRLMLKNQYALVLLDLSLSGISGLEALEIMRTGHGLIELPILVVSSSTESKTVIRALHLGANDYVCKPVDMHTLVARVNVQMSRRKIFIELLQTKQDLERTIADNSVDNTEGGIEGRVAIGVAHRAIKRDVSELERFVEGCKSADECPSGEGEIAQALELCRRVRGDCELLRLYEVSTAADRLETAIIWMSKCLSSRPELVDDAHYALRAQLTELWNSLIRSDNAVAGNSDELAHTDQLSGRGGAA